MPYQTHISDVKCSKIALKQTQQIHYSKPVYWNGEGKSEVRIQNESSLGNCINLKKYFTTVHLYFGRSQTIIIHMTWYEEN